ncbi:hypothetical protein DERP_003528 [Dermatophagoides pteronyssinus]|uniref:Uncharacterized protein n=1 Tax=Dermatophagoides pteronyssinus TaxID=6956 RepID=A0ABQ8JLM0_DERPT|nr:hypothetical protein DERP_003528 [Dermatophagoides pteronyssinus]
MTISYFGRLPYGGEPQNVDSNSSRDVIRVEKPKSPTFTVIGSEKNTFSALISRCISDCRIRSYGVIIRTFDCCCCLLKLALRLLAATRFFDDCELGFDHDVVDFCDDADRDPRKNAVGFR